MRFPALIAFATALSGLVLLVQFPVVAQSVPAVVVTGVTPNQSSARVFYNPVPGAKDYRIYDVANPTDVKYAGMAHYVPADNCPGDYCLHHFGTNSDGSITFPYQVMSDNQVQKGANTVQDVPAVDIEWNGLLDAAQHTLVVQAVDALGPVPQENLYSTDGCCNAHVPLAGGGMLGSNKGHTADGNLSTNGQGPFTNAPKVIAQSQPFVVQANQALTPLGNGSQQFLDTFDQSEAVTVKQVSRNDCGTDAVGNLGSMTYSLNAGTAKEWGIEYRQADNANSMPFISNAHFMDMLFSGATPNCNAPTDTIYGSMSMSPKQSVDMTSGGILHMTMEVDAHMSFRRWLAFDLSPASAPLQAWEAGSHQINAPNQGMLFEVSSKGCTLNVYNGPSSGGPPTASYSSSCGTGELYMPNDFMENGRGLDDRSRLDLFVSQTHLAFFQDNKLAFQTDIPAGSMPWFSSQLKAYYTHYAYHLDADIGDMKGFVLSGGTYAFPLNSYWFNDPVNGTSASSDSAGIAYPPGYGFPYSDERHWDNMGFEVMSPTDDFASFGPNVALPVPQTPMFATAPANTPVATDAPVTATPVTTAAPTSTPMPAGIPTSTATCEVLVRDHGVLKFAPQQGTTACGD